MKWWALVHRKYEATLEYAKKSCKWATKGCVGNLKIILPDQQNQEETNSLPKRVRYNEYKNLGNESLSFTMQNFNSSKDLWLLPDASKGTEWSKTPNFPCILSRKPVVPT